MNSVVATAARRVIARRSMSTPSASSSSSKEVHPGYKKIKAKYEQFQIDDGTPIHLKGGSFDRVLYLTTLGLCGVGVVGCIDYYISAGFPKK